MSSKDEGYSGEIRIRGVVDITNGSYHQRARNHFVNYILYQLGNFMATGGTSSGGWTYGTANNWYVYPFTKAHMEIGSDTVTPTTFTTSDLVSPLSGGTAPTSQSGSTQTIANGCAVNYTGEWQPNTVSGTVGEMGLFLCTGTTLNAFPTVSSTMTMNGTQVPILSSRLSEADGDFVSFVIDVTKPLTINWTVSFTFV